MSKANLSRAAAIAIAERMPDDGRRRLLLAQLRAAPAASLPELPAARIRGSASLPRAVGNAMNKTEAAFAARLDVLLAAGQVAWYRFGSVRLRLADPTGGSPAGTWHKVDFAVGLPGGQTMFVEVKGGHVTEGGRLRWLWAAAQYPQFRFQMWQRRRGDGWALVRDSRPEQGAWP